MQLGAESLEAIWLRSRNKTKGVATLIGLKLPVLSLARSGNRDKGLQTNAHSSRYRSIGQ